MDDDFDQAKALYENATSELASTKEQGWRTVITYGGALWLLLTQDTNAHFNNMLGHDTFRLMVLFGGIFSIWYLWKQFERLLKYRRRVNAFYDNYISAPIAEKIDPHVHNRPLYGLDDAAILVAQVLFVLALGVAYQFPEMYEWCR